MDPPVNLVNRMNDLKSGQFAPNHNELMSSQRRGFLAQAGGGFVATALAGMLAEDGLLGKAAAASPKNPLTPRESHYSGKAKSVIFLFMYGGPSQVDLFDPKPELTKNHGKPIPNLKTDRLLQLRAPGNLMASTRTFKKHGESGIDVSDLYPNVAKCVDDIALVRSMYTDSFAHGGGLIQMNTGMLRQGYPSLGSWVTYGLGSMNQNLPGYVVMIDHRGGPINGPPNWSSGFMPASFQGTQFKVDSSPILNLASPAGTSRERRRDSLDLLKEFNSEYAEQSPLNTELAARMESYDLAFRMQKHAPEAVDLAQESETTKRLYGLDNDVTSRFGRRCLMARRLVERGVRFVQVYSGGGHGDSNWDAHNKVNNNHQIHCDATDIPIYGLLTDLKQRGLLDETLVVWTGEFGRTPTSERDLGRDHNPRGFSAWLAGGGVKGGQIIGATDDFGYESIENKVHVNDLHANILNILGLDHTALTYFHAGRDHRLTDVHGRILPELLG